MPRPRISELHKYYTTGSAARELGLSLEELYRRLNQGVLPAPTYVNAYGLRFFDDNWLHIARAVIDQERQRAQQQ